MGFFLDNTRVRIFLFCRAKREFFFPEFYIRLYVKNSESDIFFSSTKIRIFFSATLGIRIFFFRKKNITPPLEVKQPVPNSFVFNSDKLVIFTYKNTIYQSKLNLLAIFVTILVCKQHTLFQIWKQGTFSHSTNF